MVDAGYVLKNAISQDTARQQTQSPPKRLNVTVATGVDITRGQSPTAIPHLKVAKREAKGWGGKKGDAKGSGGKGAGGKAWGVKGFGGMGCAKGRRTCKGHNGSIHEVDVMGLYTFPQMPLCSQ